MTHDAPRSPGRRRSLTVLAGLACLPLAGAGGGAAAGAQAAAGAYRWRGTALGATAELRFAGVGRAAAEAAGARVIDEIDRLERVFSLWRGDSELSRLNAAGHLRACSHDLRLVLAEAAALSRSSGGAFDCTVQPLWQLHAGFAARGATAPPDLVRETLARVDHRGIRLDGGNVAFARPGMAATLNGIAQGYITDRVAALLRRLGFRRVLVQLGEIYALGRPPGLAGWRVALPDPAGGPARRLLLADRALAVSAGAAHRFAPAGGPDHLLDPRDGGSPRHVVQVGVEAATALHADGLSTALCFLRPAEARAVLRGYPGTRAIYHLADGRRVEVGAPA